MGIVKDMWMQSNDLGWFPNGDGKYVCKNCIEDEALQQVVEEKLESSLCSYCDKESEVAIAAPLDEITKHIAICISREYTDPAETLPYESREGGYLGTVYSIEELFEEIDFWVNDNLMEDICSSFSGTAWAMRDWMTLKPEQRKIYGWNGFKRAVRHKRRYTFWSMDDEFEDKNHPDYMPVGNTLNEISSAIKSTGLIKPLKIGTNFWRVRIHNQTEMLQDDKDFASPTTKQAIRPNRMSPAGIPMFYAAEDFQTSYLETINKDKLAGKRVSGGYFSNLFELNILDLADSLIIPSYFDEQKVELRNELIFMSQFAQDISIPIVHDGREHIGYVPTQVFTEYIRWMIESPSKQAVDGICYRSSKNNKKCYVLFFTQDECIGNPQDHLAKQCLQFQSDSLHSIDPNEKLKNDYDLLSNTN